MQNKPKILIVSGGIDDPMAYNIVIHNMSLQDKFEKYDVNYAVLDIDGSINFPTSFDKDDIEKAQKYDIFEGGSHIKKMNIDCIFYVPNSWKALTTYRSVFELLDIPLVGNSADAQNLAFNKISTRIRMMADGIQCAPGCIITYEEKDNLQSALNKFKENNFTFPVIVKAPCDDDSLGIFVIKKEEDLMEKINKALELGQNKTEILIEKFIPGRELRTAMIRDENNEYFPLASCEFILNSPNDIREFKHKQATFMKEEKKTDVKILDRVYLDEEKEKDLVARLNIISQKCSKAIDIDDFGIYDFRYNVEDDEIYLLEAGLANWFSPRSNITLMAKEVGVTQETIIDNCFNNAIKRFKAKKAKQINIRSFSQ